MKDIFWLLGPLTTTEMNQLCHEFATLVNDIETILDKSTSFQEFKLACYNIITAKKFLLFSEKEVKAVKNTKSVSDVFNCLQGHWRWDSHQLLSTLIELNESYDALQKLRLFEAKIDYKRRLDEFSSYFQSMYEPLPQGCTRMMAIIEKKYSELSLKDCAKLDSYLAEALGGTTLRPPFYDESNLVEVTWYIPVESVSRLLSKGYEARELFELLSISFFQIDDVVIWKKKWPYLLKVCTHTYMHIGNYFLMFR